MLPTRRARLESVILEELSKLISRELKDPRIPPISLTSVKVTEDAGQAMIHFMISRIGAPLPEEGEARKKIIDNCVAGLQSAEGFMRRHLSKILNIRQTPGLTFREDRGLDNAQRVHELLQQISGEEKTKS